MSDSVAGSSYRDVCQVSVRKCNLFNGDTLVMFIDVKKDENELIKAVEEVVTGCEIKGTKINGNILCVYINK